MNKEIWEIKKKNAFFYSKVDSPYSDIKVYSPDGELLAEGMDCEKFITEGETINQGSPGRSVWRTEKFFKPGFYYKTHMNGLAYC